MKTSMNASRYSITIEGDSIPILIKRHPSSRRIIIRYQPLKHSVGLTLPRYAPIRQGLRFIEEKRSWIEGQIKKSRLNEAERRLVDGSTLSVLGKNYRLRHVDGRGLVRIEGEEIIVPGDAAFFARRLTDWLKRELKEEITKLATAKSAQIGRNIKKITLRDTTSHWGSCTHTGSLSFSWRMVFAPYEVLDYLVSHEVAHLAELNHSKAFWGVVESLFPRYEAAKAWLAVHGHHLYTIR